MKMYPLFLSLLIITSLPVLAYGQNCEDIYKAAVQAEKDGQYKNAIELIDNLNNCIKYFKTGDAFKIKAQQLNITLLKDINEQKTIAIAQRKIAIDQKNLAINQSYSNAAYAFADKDPTIAINFAVKALSMKDNLTAKIALVKAFNTGSWFYSQKFPDTYDADLSPDGNLLGLVTTSNKIKIVDLRTRTSTLLKLNADHIHFLPTGNILIWGSGSEKGKPGTIYLLDRLFNIIFQHQIMGFSVFVSGSGKIFVIVSITGTRDIELRSIDQSTGDMTKIPLDCKRDGASVKCAYDEESGATVVSQESPGKIWIVDRQQVTHTIVIPENYEMADIDVRYGQIALFLRGGIVGLKDGLGLYSLLDNYREGLRFVPLKNVPTEDAGGVVKVLSKTKIIISSTEGWTKIIRSNSTDTTEITGSRAADLIAVSASTDYFALAHRSGETYIYDSDGNLNSQLLGGIFSDGLNPAYSKFLFSGNGAKIITVNKYITTVWEKPKYQLVIPSTIDNSRENAVYNYLPYFLKFKRGRLSDNLMIRIDRDARLITNTGQVLLQFRYGSRTDYIQTGMTKNDLSNTDIFAEGPIKGLGYSFDGDKLERIFITDPSVILGIVNEEISSKRLCPLEADIVKSWINNALLNTAAK